MTWFDRSPGGKKSPAETPLPQDSGPMTPRQPAVAPPEKGLVAYLYRGSRVAGQLTFHGPATIDGNVEGEIICHGMLTIGSEAEVRAKVSGEVVVIRGKVEGDVTAKERVELAAPARLFGNIDTPRLAVGDGVVFDGHCSMVEVRQKGGGRKPVTDSER